MTGLKDTVVYTVKMNFFNFQLRLLEFLFHFPVMKFQNTFLVFF